MLKKIIILLSVFAIENNLIGAQAFNPMSFIEPATREDLANANFNGTCPICLYSESDINMFFDISMFYKANCPSVDMVPHIFHRDCILRYIDEIVRRSNMEDRFVTCPLCRGNMAEDALPVVNLIELNEEAEMQILEAVLILEEERRQRLEEIVRLIVDGADINILYDWRTALMMAIDQGNVAMVELLIDRGASLNLQNGLGETALDIAISLNSQGIVALLLSHGAVSGI